MPFCGPSKGKTISIASLDLMVSSLARFPSALMLHALFIKQLLLSKILLSEVSEFYGGQHNLIINT